MSLRTLQFTRAAGEAGHLTTPTPVSSTEFTPDPTTEPNHHSTLTGAIT